MSAKLMPATPKQKAAPQMSNFRRSKNRTDKKAWKLEKLWGVRTFLWLFFNNVETDSIPGQLEYSQSFATLSYGKTHVADLHTYAEGLYKLSVDAIKESNDRIEKLLAIVLLAMGWIVSKESFSVLALSSVGFSALVLICGRAKVVEFIPATFETFTAEAMMYGKDEDAGYLFNRAAQYAKVFNANQYVVKLNHMRLTVAVFFLIAGLIAYGLRIWLIRGF